MLPSHDKPLWGVLDKDVNQMGSSVRLLIHTSHAPEVLDTSFVGLGKSPGQLPGTFSLIQNTRDAKSLGSNGSFQCLTIGY